MKKLFHLALTVLIVFSVTSCTKSSNDLVADKKADTAQRNLVTPTSKLAPLNPMIYDFITEPIETLLGDPSTAILYAGPEEIAVFYVIIPNDYTEQSINGAWLTMIKDATGPVNSYEMMYMDRGSNYDLKVPEQLINQTYMFARVNLKDLRDPEGTVFNPRNNIVSLRANVQADGGNLSLEMRHAFSYIQ